MIQSVQLAGSKIMMRHRQAEQAAYQPISSPVNPALNLVDCHQVISAAIALSRSRNHRCPGSVVWRGCQYIATWMSGRSKGDSINRILVVAARRRATRSRTWLTSSVPWIRKGTNRKLSTVTSIRRGIPSFWSGPKTSKDSSPSISCRTVGSD